MANFSELSSDNQKIFDNLIQKSDLERVVNFVLLANNNLKQIGLVKRADDILKHLTENDVAIVINEEIFDNLELNQKELIADDLMASVSYNFDKDKLVITKPDILAHSGVLKKYGAESYLNVHEIIRLALQQKEDLKKESSKSKKPKNNIE